MTNPMTETDGVDLDGLAAPLSVKAVIGDNGGTNYVIYDANRSPVANCALRGDALWLCERCNEAIAQRDRADRLAADRAMRDRLIARACREWDSTDGYGGPFRCDVSFLEGMVSIGFMETVEVTKANLLDYEDEGWEIGDTIYSWTVQALQALKGGDDG